jgi:hypothetical protein
MDNKKSEKARFRKGFVAILILAIALFGFYNMLLGLLKYLGII